jgi:hypothetical protein
MYTKKFLDQAASGEKANLLMFYHRSWREGEARKVESGMSEVVVVARSSRAHTHAGW